MTTISINDLETRLNNTFPNCIKSSRQVILQVAYPEVSQAKIDKKTIKAISIFHPHEHYKHIGFVIPNFGFEYLGISRLVDEYQKGLDFDKVKLKFNNLTQPGHLATEKDFIFTKKVYVFTDEVDSEIKSEEVIKHFRSNGLFLEIRDNDYHKQLILGKPPDVFICHDSRDKEFAENLAFDLENSLVKVWYDAYTLKIGDSLTTKIQDGISKTKFGIILLSKHFLSNERWVKFELQSLMAKQIVSKKKVILPVWHGITSNDLNDYPWLLDKVALNSDMGVKGIAFKIKTLVDEYEE